jgi:hypothetical protein
MLLAVVGLFLQGSEGGHMLLVEHARCAEHGDLIHAADGHDHGLSEARDGAVPAFKRGSDPDDESAHAHCNHASERRDLGVEVSATELVELRESVALSTEPGVAARASRAPLYRTAPKNSPPA